MAILISMILDQILNEIIIINSFNFRFVIYFQAKIQSRITSLEWIMMLCCYQRDVHLAASI